MNITLPSVEYKDISVDSYMETPSDNELIIYFEIANKIVVMNETTTCIWKFIINSINDNLKDYITVYDILNYIKTKFDKDSPSDCDVINDIIEIINMFFVNELLRCKKGVSDAWQ